MIENFEGQAVLVRVDFNVPLDDSKSITDDTRIRAALPTIQYLLNNNAKVILMSHLGRPQKKTKEDGSLDKEKFSLLPIADHLSKLTDTCVHFVLDSIGESVHLAVENLKTGEILLLENTRFYPEEEAGGMDYARSLSSLAPFYVNDAFGTAHRRHASTAVVADNYDQSHKSFGFLMEKEIANANKVLKQAQSPFVCILGGAKVSDKIELIKQLMPIADIFIIGGAMAFTFVKARGEKIGKSLVEDDKLELARDLVQMAADNGTELLLPIDAIAATEFSEDAEYDYYAIDQIPDDRMGLDIGPGSIELFSNALQCAKTILWNGPMGVFEIDAFSTGTKEIAVAVANQTKGGAFSMVGGGDSVAAINSLGLAEEVSFVSTGGGAMLEYLEGKVLPGIEVMNK